MQSEPEPARRAPNSSWLQESAPRHLAPVPARPGTQSPVVPLRPPDDGAGMAMAAFILGIASVFLAFVGACALPFGITGLVLGLTGRRSTRRHHFAVAGVALSGIGIVLALGATIVWLYVFGAFH
ncbi:MAG TPA: DUF4190 domain-containing protein [Ktedonobacterales bacterium]